MKIKTTNEIGPLIRNPTPKTSHIDIGMIKSNKIDFLLFKMIFNNKYCWKVINDNNNVSVLATWDSNINNNDIIEALTTNKDAFCPNRICENFHNTKIVIRAPSVDTYLYDEILSSPNILAKIDCAQ